MIGLEGWDTPRSRADVIFFCSKRLMWPQFCDPQEFAIRPLGMSL